MAELEKTPSQAALAATPVPPSTEPPASRSSRPGSQINLAARQSSTSAPSRDATAEPSKIASEQPVSSVDAAPAAGPTNEANAVPYGAVYDRDTFFNVANKVPETEALARAKAYLQQSDGKKGSIFEHLTQTVMKILDRRPSNPVDVIENISAEVKRSKFRVENPNAPTALRTATDESKVVALAQEKYEIFKPKENDLEENPEAGEIPDIMDLATLWEWSGFTLGTQTDTQTLALSIRSFVNTRPLKSVRVWGKIFGTSKNYIIIEGELKEGEPDEEGDQANQMYRAESGAASPTDAEHAESPGAEKDDKFLEGTDDGEFLPKPKQKVVPPLRKEERVGVNNGESLMHRMFLQIAGGPWTRLPDVSPEKLQAARKIRKFLTGDLKRKIVSYPPFDGSEAQYLRCQIARISAATVASPAGYYTADPEEAADEDPDHPTTIIINPDFPGSPNSSLLDPNQWVHHVPYILPQGRTTWANPNPPKEEGEGGDEENAAEEPEQEPVEPESGPAILRNLADDETFGTYPAWSSLATSRLAPARFRPVCLRSVRWPGALVVAHSDRFCSLYVGDGIKALSPGAELFAGPSLGPVQAEWTPKEGEEAVEEKKDPTVEEEKAFEEAQAEKEEEHEEGEGEEGDAEEEA
ncbi:hypothetical protein SmJEL517_g05852 [Synchytrium microbalum]|uniref:Radial spokehead-like protein n=1 Tax=Synchytrium microbalum TaxID=1806994 RepID=A0A507BLQ5_9FUNG|nr:uncharacterized protein SmJEL517_g05852 [Synchytrium microbalum]TPX30627.1 hypothetical protein SmJEL517_g05852 [Synchytrium microbalum]